MPKVSLLYKWFAPQMQDSLGPDNRTIAYRTIRKTLLRYGLLNFGVNFVMFVSGFILAAGGSPISANIYWTRTICEKNY